MKSILLVLLCGFPAVCGPLEEWRTFELQVRDQTIPRDSAVRHFKTIYSSLIRYSTGFSFSNQSEWVFPVEDCSVDDAGKNSYRPDSYYGGSPIKGYDFFDGNRHGGHPAYDIFIRDRNRDCRDDRTGMSVGVIAPCDMLIVSTNVNWHEGSELRGGRYIWALAPQTGMLLYFAHLDSISVSAGEVVYTGQRMGTVGRTGKNAVLKTSATHLHMMVLQIANDDMITPVDFLKNFSRKRNGQ
jgi:peptidoglycan LD-endopeptidase LytH